MEVNTEETDDSKNGVLCWFYVYKKNETGGSSICGIVIIKQLTDTETDNESGSSSLLENKIFFYAKTDLKIDCPDGPWRGCSHKYNNDVLIHNFIHTKPNNEDTKKFITENNDNPKFIIDHYLKLSNFLKYLIEKNFDIFHDISDDQSVQSWTSSIITPSTL